MLSISLRQEIKAHARETFPFECCGYVLNVKGKEEIFRCRNSSDKPDELFCISPSETEKAEKQGQIIALYHSHPNERATPSDTDKAMAEALELPSYIYALPVDEWSEYIPCGYKLPLLGRKFIHGQHDCYSLVRDYFREQLQITLPDFERRDEWWKNGDNLYYDNFEKAGFFRVTDLKKHDCILMTVLSKVMNHAAIYVGNNLILHHVYGRLSCREPYGGYWSKNACMIVRHKDLANL